MTVIEPSATPARSEFHERIYCANYSDEIYVDSDAVDFIEGDWQPLVSLALVVGDESLSVQLDDYHLKQLQATLRRAARWLAQEKTAGGALNQLKESNHA
jgi:hypothetical protein